MKKLFVTVVAGSALLSSWSVADQKADVMALGKQKFLLCAACHGVDGKGMQPAPGMLMAASWVDSKILKKGSSEVIVAILMRGIKKVNPTEYMGQIMQPLGAAMPDEDVAAIVTYVRNTFGGHDDVVTPDQVKEWRAKYPTTEGPMERAKLDEMAGVTK